MHARIHPAILISVWLALAGPAACAAGAPPGAKVDAGLFARTNLVAWCIVPFDAKKRGPEERAAMLQKLGFKLFAYDYRAEHIPAFDAEMEALERHHVRLLAWWFPGTLNDEARLILDVLKRHGLRDAQLWVTGGGEPTKNADEQAGRVEAEATRIMPIAAEAAKLGCVVALYNHGGWFGEPENQLAIIERLRAAGTTNVGIVYNQHHGHGQLDRFPELLQRMKPHLLALNLNGMVRDGEKTGKLILPLGQGDLDLKLLRIIRDSGWSGPIGILNHTDEDAETRLQENLRGLERLVAQLEQPGRTGVSPAPPRSKSGTGETPVLHSKYWAVEDPKEREKLPLYQTIPAARPDELTPANGFPKRETYRTWHRSHGDNGGRRFSALDQINRRNVTNLQVAWTYHSRDGSNFIQCNPIIVDGVMFAPTPGKFLAAVNAENGAEIWRFKPEGKPAFRGLIYWPGGGAETGSAGVPPASSSLRKAEPRRRDAGALSGGSTVADARVLFCAGKFLYALHPQTGRAIADFGDGGKALLPGRAQGDFGAATAGPAIFERIIVVPGFEKDVWGFDVVSGRHLWTFHTVPQPGEFGYDTWDGPVSYGANCWGGMALDEVRGIAYVTTGSPKDNFIGVNHRGDNLFANCVIALDARTGKRLWHFQEIRHDIWDLDIPAPPNLATITRDGQRVDVVAACTKIGNTLLLDRVTGKPIFPFRLRRAPTSDLRGEQTSPYQPDVELPERFSKMEYTAADLTDRTDEAADYALTRFKSAHTGFFRPCSEGRPNLFLGVDGGAEWTGACVDPDTGRLYVSANHMGWNISVFRDDDPRDDPQAPKTRGQIIFEITCAQCHGTNRLGLGMAPPLRGLRHRLTDEAVIQQIRTGKNAMPAQPQLSDAEVQAVVDYLMLRDRPLPPAPPPSERPVYSYSGYPKFYDHEGYPANKPPWGTLNCLDLNTGKLVWKVPLGEYPELTAQGVPKTGTENYGGAIVTAGGLVFCAGTRDNRIRAFDKDTGAELWSAKLPWTGNAPPASYQVNGRQFIVIAATGGNKLGTPYGDAYVAFALPK
jgi:quinoprotein glucose dehydrogenase